MGHFDRYETHLDDLENAFRDDSYKYCNPKDYFVTEDECRQYLKDLKEAREKNRDLNYKRRLKNNRFFLIAFIVFIVFYIAVVVLWNPNISISSNLSFPILCLVGVIAICLLFWAYNYADKYIQLHEIIYLKFYPPINENIEKLFDDYIWKGILEYNARSKGDIEKEMIRQRIETMSHPYIHLFKQAIEEELSNPSEDYVFGDIKFGMTPEEIHKTKVFRGVNKTIVNNELDFEKRNVLLGKYLGMGDLDISTHFHFSERKLIMFTIKSKILYKKRSLIIPSFISCCKTLYNVYGNLRSSKEDIKSIVVDPYSDKKAEFWIGRKCVSLYIVKTSEQKFYLELDFCQASNINDSTIDTQCNMEDLLTIFNGLSTSLEDYLFKRYIRFRVWGKGGPHGEKHCDRVYENGQTLMTVDVNPRVVFCFSYLHDCFRINEEEDLEHGERAAEWLDKVRDTVFKKIPDEEFLLLKEACRLHSKVDRTGNPTIDACFDADRLDLWNVGIIPDPQKMATERGKEIARNTDYASMILNAKDKRTQGLS